MLIYVTIIFIIYFVFLLACLTGWQKFVRGSTPSGYHPKGFEALSPQRHRESTDYYQLNYFVSVVVAVRNEEGSISRLLDSLEVQDFPRSNFEVILVNDHSTDASAELIDRWIESNQQLQVSVLQSPGEGKKHALTEGIQRAKGEIILTTDADCVLPLNWISKMVLSFDVVSHKITKAQGEISSRPIAFTAASDTTMVIGIVNIQQDKSFFSKLQAIEFSSLTGTGIAMLKIGFPVMCNGASLGFRKKSFEAVGAYKGNLHIPSGDDEFLMRKLNHRFPGSIKAVEWPALPVTTEAQPSLKKFIHQRLRWAGKWKANDSFSTKILALFMLVFQITYVVTIGLLFAGENLLEMSTLLSIKILLEGYFLFNVSRALRQRFSVMVFILLQCVYPIYVVMIGILSQLLTYEWKGREG